MDGMRFRSLCANVDRLSVGQRLRNRIPSISILLQEIHVL